MEPKQHDLQIAENAILSEVEMGSSSPAKLIENLKSQRLDEDLIRGAIWLLIDQGRLDLSWDLQLHLPQASAA